MLSAELRRWLAADEITRVVTGHWPHGDSPLFIKSGSSRNEGGQRGGEGGGGGGGGLGKESSAKGVLLSQDSEVLVVAADTSYSDSSAPDKRGYVRCQNTRSLSPSPSLPTCFLACG